jgi:YfiR/HmsC-like
MTLPRKNAAWWKAAGVAMSLGVAALCASRSGMAQVSSVPAEIQAELLSKLEGYDRGFSARAGDTARVLLVVKPGSTKSEISAEEMRSALGRIDRFAGLPHQETIVPYPGAQALAQRCRADKIAVVYFTPGFDDEVDALRVALADDNVLSLGAVSDYVPKGIVLGFELESGKPKILINLEQAKRQGVNFPSDVLRLMTVYR